MKSVRELERTSSQNPGLSSTHFLPYSDPKNPVLEARLLESTSLLESNTISEASSSTAGFWKMRGFSGSLYSRSGSSDWVGRGLTWTSITDVEKFDFGEL